MRSCGKDLFRAQRDRVATGFGAVRRKIHANTSFVRRYERGAERRFGRRAFDLHADGFDGVFSLGGRGNTYARSARVYDDAHLRVFYAVKTDRIFRFGGIYDPRNERQSGALRGRVRDGWIARKRGNTYQKSAVHGEFPRSGEFGLFCEGQK